MNKAEFRPSGQCGRRHPPAMLEKVGHHPEPKGRSLMSSTTHTELLIEEAFAAAGVTGYFHAVDLGSGAQVGVNADDFVVTASVFKLPVLLELFRQHHAGERDASTQVTVPVENRSPGPNGLSIMRDPMTASLRDLAWLMMGISDNAATDFICDQLGFDAITKNLRSLGIERTSITGDCRDLFGTMVEDLGYTSFDEFGGDPLTWEQFHLMRACDPQRTIHQSTPRDLTTLLALIWDDKAASPEACADVRAILGLQVWPHRLASGFPGDDVRTSGKTGTLPSLRNEVGVVEYADGGRYAVATFTRASTLANKNPAADAVIGTAARIAVDHFRAH